MNKKILRLRTGNKTRTILQRKYLAWEEHWGKGRKFSHRENIGFVGGGLGEDIIVWFYNIKGGIQSKDKEDLFSLHNHRMWRKDTVCWGIYMQRSTKPEQRKKQGNTFFLSIFIRKATMTTFNCSNIEPWTRLTLMFATKMGSCSLETFSGEAQLKKTMPKAQVLKQILIRFHLHNLDQAATSIPQPNISSKILTKLQF